MADVVVIGGIFQEILPPAENPVRRAGGSGFVAALTAAALGAEVALISYVGEKDAPAALTPLRRAGVDIGGVQVIPGRSGIFAFADHVDRRAPRPGYRPAEAVPASIDDASVPSGSVVLAFGFPGFDPLPWITAALRESGVLMWDRQGWLSRDLERHVIRELPAARRIYVANLEEMRAQSNRATYAEALAEQPAAAFDAALIKCGRWGTLAIDSDRIDFVPAVITKAASVIGSGDCFGGAVAARLAAGDSLGGAARVGAAAASLFIERLSNIPPAGMLDAITHVLDTRVQRAVNPVRLERVAIYLAGPWFTAAEAMLIDELVAVLDNMGMNVISPRRDIGALSPRATREEARELGRRDYATIDACDLVVAVLDGNDPGTLMEVGYAAKARKPIVALSSLAERRLEPMREAAGVRVASSVKGLIEEVTEWVRERHGIG